MSKMFYQPDDAWVGDLIPYYEDGTYYAFYLHDPRCYPNQYAEKTTWYLVTTKDFKELKIHGEAIARGGDDRPNKNAYTGSVIRDRDGLYHVFYTAFNADIQINGKSVQSVMQATGKDLYHLNTIEDWIFTADGTRYEEFDWRDPYVFLDPTDGRYKMLLAARKAGSGALRGGCIALCSSDDLIHWDYEDPFYEPERYVTMECPEVFQMGDWYYLAFSTFSDRFTTHYRKSRSLQGPWEIPEDDVYDTRANYAIKTAGFGRERYAFGWIASKKGNCDDGPWEWGGTMDFMKIVQDEQNGELHAIPTEGNQAFFNKEMPSPKPVNFHASLSSINENGGVQISPDGAELGAALFPLPDEDFEADFDVRAETLQEFGVLLHTSADLENGYFLRFYPKLNRVAWDRWPRTNAPGIYQWQINGDVPYAIETERYLPKTEEYRIRIMKEESICVVYINDRIALSTRQYDHTGGMTGIYITSDAVTLERFSLRTR